MTFLCMQPFNLCASSHIPTAVMVLVEDSYGNNAGELANKARGCGSKELKLGSRGTFR